MLALRILRGLRIRRAPITGEIFYSLREAKVLIVQLRVHYNSVRPHRALLYRPPALESIVPMDQNPALYLQLTRTIRWGTPLAHSLSSIVDLIQDEELTQIPYNPSSLRKNEIQFRGMGGI